MSTYLTVLVSASLLSLIACAAPTGSEDPAAGAPAADEPAAPAADPGASEPGFAPLPERAGSSAPLPAIRSCGRALTAPTKLDTQATWVAFGPAAVGAKVVTASPLQLGAAIVSGSLTRPPTGVKTAPG